MPIADEDREDADVPMLAEKALNEATRRSIEAGFPQVVVIDDKLVRITAAGVEVLKTLPPRKAVGDAKPHQP